MDGRLLVRRQTLPKEIADRYATRRKGVRTAPPSARDARRAVDPSDCEVRGERHCAQVPVLSQGMARDVCEDEQQAERGLLEGVDHPLSPLAVFRQAASLRNRGSRARALQERATLEGLVAEDDQQPALGPSEGTPLCSGVGRDRGGAHHQVDEGAAGPISISSISARPSVFSTQPSRSSVRWSRPH